MKRKRFQFSLRWLLIVTALLSVVSGVALRSWYFERVKVREAKLRSALVRVFLANEFLSLDAERKKETGVPLQFDRETGIVSEGSGRYHWDLEFLCSNFVQDQPRTYIDVQITYTSASTGAGPMRFKFSSDEVGFEARVREFLNKQGWEYEIVKAVPPSQSSAR